MASIQFINRRLEGLVRRCRLDQFDDVMHRHDGQKIRTRVGRAVTQVEVLHDGQPVRLFIKRDWRTQLKDRIQCWLDGLGWGTKARREWIALRAMAAAGIGCPEPLVFIERGGLRPRGYLILLEMPGAVELTRYLATRGKNLSARNRRQLAAHLGHEVARLHNAGIDHPDLYSKHIFLTDSESDPLQSPARNLQPPTLSPKSPSPLPHVSFIDMQRSSAGDSVSIAQRVRDLAALNSPLPPELANRVDRLVFVHSYLSQTPLSLDLGQFVAAIRRRSSKLSRRTKIRTMQRMGRELALTLS